MSKDPAPSAYRSFLASIKERIELARVQAVRAAFHEGVLLYWDIGRAIVEKQESAGWGDSIVERLASDLRLAFPDSRGFSADNLWRARQFYSEYISPDFLEQVVPETTKRGRRMLEQSVPETRSHQKSLAKGKKGDFLEQAVPETRSHQKSLAKGRKGDFLEQPVPETRSHQKSLAKGRKGDFLEQPVPETQSHQITRVNDGEGDFLEQSVPEIEARKLLVSVPWGHHVELLKKIKDPAARVYYLRAIARLGWTRNVLLNQIKSKAYERAVTEKKTHNFSAALPEHFAEQANEIVKNRYDFAFLGVGQAIKERELESNLIDALQSFILELGYGFCFVGRQYRLTTGRKEYFVDLLFYHRFLKALVAFDLKIGSFEPEHAGKMDFYLNILNEKERAPDDAPSIGIILCAEKDEIDVEFALKSKSNPIGVAVYELQATLPAELKGRLPSAKQLAAVVRESLKSRNK